MDQNSMKNAFFILLSVGVLLVLYPLVHDRSEFLKENFRSYHLKDRFLLDTLAVHDTLSMDSSMVVLSSHSATAKNLYSGQEYLKSFFDSLLKERGQTRIAYYGDSSIEGDLITQTVRDSLQRKFGGSGVGFVPIASHLKGFRRSVYLNFSEDWARITMNKPAPPGIHFGYIGTTFGCKSNINTPPDTLQYETVEPDSLSVGSNDSIIITEPLVVPPQEPVHEGVYSVRYAASRIYKGTYSFPKSRLFYSCPVDSFGQKGRVNVGIGESSKALHLNGNNTVNEKLLAGYPHRRIQLDFDSICNQVIYGVSFESDEGVILDNLPFRGNSGVWLTRIRSGVLQSFQNKLGVDLVVLQFGLNVLNPKMKDYSWYASDMKRVIDHIRRGFPETSILIVGPADKAIKLDGVMQTDPSIPLITNVLREVAQEKDVAFFSFFEAMGGKNSMVDWVEKKEPRLANTDYTHFNFEGAEKAGHLLLHYLFDALDFYKSEQQKETVQF